MSCLLCCCSKRDEIYKQDLLTLRARSTPYTCHRNAIEDIFRHCKRYNRKNIDSVLSGCCCPAVPMPTNSNFGAPCQAYKMDPLFYSVLKKIKTTLLKRGDNELLEKASYLENSRAILHLCSHQDDWYCHSHFQEEELNDYFSRKNEFVDFLSRKYPNESWLTMN